MTQDLEATIQLFGSYLHQDWIEEFEDDLAAVRVMKDSEPSEILFGASTEIRKLLSAPLDDAELRRIMVDRVGCYFDPASRGQTYREWLEVVLKLWES